MVETLDFTDVLAAVLDKLREKTKCDCYDAIPDDAPLPHIMAEITGQRPAPSKTMQKEVFTVYIHAIAQGPSSQPVFELVKEITEAMTEKIPLPHPERFDVLMQRPTGAQRILTEVDGCKHAIMGYDITITYGYKFKI